MHFSTLKTFLVSSLCFSSIEAAGPFLKTVGEYEHIIGNDLWNITIGRQYGTKLYYKDHDLVGDAWGHYVSYNGAESDLNWTSANIHEQTKDYLDVSFTAKEGDFHWVIYPDLEGAYQYFVNHDLPVLGEFRTLFRLDNASFPNGRTDSIDQRLPDLADILNSTNVQDETWERADGTFITKYDLATFIRDTDYYGVYGDNFGSWYINAGKDDYNGDHLNQELMVHRESETGDAVQLNMIHGTHFQASSNDTFADNRTWGPWLWYLNDGCKEDVAERSRREMAEWPYRWFQDEAYQSRGSVRGRIVLSDGRPASNAAVFLGDNNPTKSTLDQGTTHYYTGYTDRHGAFEFTNVRTGAYGLQAWSDGGRISDVTTVLLENDVVVKKGKNGDLGKLTWETQGREQIFQVGEFDRKALGFKYAGSPREHALVSKCPSDLTYTVGESKTSDWCFGQSAEGTWSIRFHLGNNAPADADSVLSVSLAGYSTGVSSEITINDNPNPIGNLTSDYILSDQCLYRSATVAGEWHYYEFPVAGDLLQEGWNWVNFTVTEGSLWHGFLWDSILLEYA